MDLRFSQAPPSPIERAAVDALLGQHGMAEDGNSERSSGATALDGRDAHQRRHLLLPALQAVQARVGWISPQALNYICQRLMVPPAEAYGVASFYALLALSPQPSTVVHVCDDLACLVNGAERLCAEVEQAIGPPGTPSPDKRATWHRSPCLGLCDRAPAALVIRAGETPQEHAIGPVGIGDVLAAMRDDGPPPAVSSPPPPGGDVPPVLLRRVGLVDPTSLDAYRACGGYTALRRAFQLRPEGILRELNDAKLLGRGGAAFPTGRKWEAVARAAVRPHYLVCNADESEPGTFKDRVLMEGDPFALVEAMTVAAYATGCEQGFIYVRGEYPLAAQRLQNAIGQARSRDLLGPNIMGRGFAFDVELRRGAGAYICGEETALLNSLEGFRGEPRNKPPFPVQVGLFGKPTVVNNVETLVNVLEIVRRGGLAYASTGTAGSAGTKLFCLSGCVRRPGVYEVPFGTTLRQLLALGGGLGPGRTLQAVLLGGAAGVFVGPDQLDTPLTFEGVRAVNATLGSGAVLVFDDRVDLKAILRRIAAFFRDESCGQCVPCRVGTVRQEELVERLIHHHPLGSWQDELTLRDEIAQVMRDASICGLGQTAAGAIGSAIIQLNIFGNERGSG